MSNDAKDLLLLLSIIALVVLCGFGGIYTINRLTCAYATDMNPQLDFQFHWWAGCLVRLDNGVLISWDKYYAVNQQE